MLHTVMTRSVLEVFWPKLNARVSGVTHKLDTHVNVTEDVESFTDKIDLV